MRSYSTETNCLDYVNDQLSYEELKQITSDLIIEALEHQLQSSLRDYCDFITRYLSINAEGKVHTCNSFAKANEEPMQGLRRAPILA